MLPGAYLSVALLNLALPSADKRTSLGQLCSIMKVAVEAILATACALAVYPDDEG